jgi:glyoxalase/bleomycin resistance protein/dioxygenase superfamily protein
MATDLPQMFHTGLIVDSLDASMRVFGIAFGYRWTEPTTFVGEIRTEGGVVEQAVRATYSMGGPHHVELVEELRGDFLRPLGGSDRAHHLGFWSDELTADVGRLVDLGFRPEMTMSPVPGEFAGIAFLASPQGGLRVELVDVAHRPGIMQWINGGQAAFNVREGDFHVG